MTFDISAIWFAFGVSMLAFLLNKMLIKMGYDENMTQNVDFIAYLIVFSRVVIMIVRMLNQVRMVFNI
jgi:hypothetical protein